MGVASELDVYQKSVKLAVTVYELTSALPVEERFGLSNQLRRAASSVGANIAEGSKRISMRERKRYHEIAIGSLEETKHHLRICYELGYCGAEFVRPIVLLCNEIGKMLTGLNKSLRDLSPR